jgi:hypothetical protein
MFSYTAFGLCINSTLPLPELMPNPEPILKSNEALTDQDIDDGCVLIREGLVNGVPPKARQSGYYVRCEADAMHAFWEEAGAFLVGGGRTITVEPAFGATSLAWRQYLLGPVFASLLHQRGYLVLHASAIALKASVGKHDGTLDDRFAIAFLGHSGQGKSTMAAALHHRGHGVVADDIIAVPTPSQGEIEVVSSSAPRQGDIPEVGTLPHIFPGYPLLKLCAQALQALDVGYASTVPVSGEYRRGRRGERVVRGYSSEPLRLRALFVLTDGEDDARCDLLRPQDALIELARHSYCAAVLPRDQKQAHFLQCAQVARQVPVYQLQRPRDLSRLDDVARLVEEQVLLKP